jgi:hypothetical protein
MNVFARLLGLEPDTPGRNVGGAPSDGRRRHQPKAALCLMLAVLWIFPTAGAAFILGTGEATWLRAGGLVAGLRAVPFEQWMAFAILLAHPVFAWLAWRLRRTEPWKEIEPEQDADLRDPT